jgi:hypothetical protein
MKRLRRALALALLLLGLASPAAAQWYAQRLLTVSLTTSGSDCTLATSCATLADNDAARRLNWTVQLTGTFTGTGQFEGTADGSTWVALSMTPSNSATTVTSATAAGLWTASVALQGLRVRASALSSGTIVATVLSR